MSKMGQLYMEVEEMLIRGLEPFSISSKLNVPLDLVLNVEEDLMQLANPYSYGPYYE